MGGSDTRAFRLETLPRLPLLAASDGGETLMRLLGRRTQFFASIVLLASCLSVGTVGAKMGFASRTHQDPQCTRPGAPLVPPPGFDPVTASDEQLACYGLPPRPSGGDALAQWNDRMSHVRRYVIPKFAVAGFVSPLQGQPIQTPSAENVVYPSQGGLHRRARAALRGTP